MIVRAGAAQGDLLATLDHTESTAQRLKLARVHREEAEAAIAAMKRDEQAKLLVQRADAERPCPQPRCLLERLVDRYTPDIAACRGDHAATHKTLSDAGHDIRTELAHQMRKRAEEKLGGAAPGATT